MSSLLYAEINTRIAEAINVTGMSVADANLIAPSILHMSLPFDISVMMMSLIMIQLIIPIVNALKAIDLFVATASEDDALLFTEGVISCFNNALSSSNYMFYDDTCRTLCTADENNICTMEDVLQQCDLFFTIITLDDAIDLHTEIKTCQVQFSTAIQQLSSPSLLLSQHLQKLTEDLIRIGTIIVRFHTLEFMRVYMLFALKEKADIFYPMKHY